MDDLKLDFNLYTKDDDHLEGLLSSVKRLSDDIVMQFDLDKSS